MKKVKFVFLNKILLLVFVLLSGKISATNYYVSHNTGIYNDLSDLPALSPGDSVFLHAGEKFREVWEIKESGTEGNYIYFGRYGTGNNPAVVGSNVAVNWTETATNNIWQTATSLTNLSDEYYAGRIFFEYDNGVQDTIGYGDYKLYTSNFSNLSEEFDYTVNGTTHYVYSTVDPDEAYDAIEVTQREQCISYSFNNYLIFDGIDVRYGRRQGYFEGYPAPRGVTNLIWRNLNVSYIGSKGSGSSYGITAFASNILIENCTFSDNGRRAISINTYTDNPGGRRIENIIIRNCRFKRGYHTTSLDLSTMNRDGDTVMNVYFYNNYIDDSEIKEIGSWGGSNQLFTQGGVGTSIMTNIYIVNNVWIESTTRNILFENSVTHYVWHNTFIALNPVQTNNIYGSIGTGGADTIDWRNNIFFDNIPNNSVENNGLHGYNAGNVYYPYRDYNLYWQLFPGNNRNFTSIDLNSQHYYYNINEWQDYKTNFPTYDQHSPNPANPLFADYNNYDLRLTELSPAKNAGDILPDVIVIDPFGNIENITKQDYIGNPRSLISPSIGAYEFYIPDSTATDILSFILLDQTSAATINNTNHTINIEVKFGTNITSLTPYINVSLGATISPASGIARNFTSPLLYTITSLDGLTSQIYTVTVTIGPEPQPNNPPVANYTIESTNIYKGILYSIDASSCNDLDSDPLTFGWEIPAEFAISGLSGPVVWVLPTENALVQSYNVELNVSDGRDNVNNTININVQNYKPDAKEINLSFVEASGFETGNGPENILDKNNDTRWSVEGDGQWIILEMDSDSYISHFKISFYNSETRSSYFEIYASTDKTNWELVLENDSSCGFSSSAQIYKISETYALNKYKFIRLVGHMNSVNTWNSFFEFEAHGYTGSVPISSDQNITMDDVLMVYPNPAKNSFNIKTERRSTILIMDITGKLIIEQFVADGEISFENKLKSGIYYIKVVGENNNIIGTKKLIVR